MLTHLLFRDEHKKLRAIGVDEDFPIEDLHRQNILALRFKNELGIKSVGPILGLVKIEIEAEPPQVA